MRSNDQERINRHRGSNTPDFVNGSARALLARAGYESKVVVVVCYCLMSGLDHFEIFALVKMNSFPGRAKNYITAYAGAVPLPDVSAESLQIDLALGIKRRGNRQK